jgi:hypothetical protein
MNSSICCLDTCFTHCDGVPSCLRFLTIATTVISGSIVATLIDKFNHQYRNVLLTDAEGFALLDLESSYLPAELLNPYAGLFDLKVADMRFPAEDTYYECLRFDVKQTYAVAGDEPDPDDLTTYPTYQLPYTYEPL